MKKLLCTFMIIMLSVLIFGCNRQQQSNQLLEITPKSSEFAVEEIPTLAGQANDNGYYSIDIPRSANDIDVLSAINNRLYFISVLMAQKNIDSFETIPYELMWETILLEISFIYGGEKPFIEHSDGRSATVSLEALKNHIKNNYNINDDEYLNTMPKNFKIEKDQVLVNYKDLEYSSAGFMMIDYKQQGNKWYIEGEIAKEDNDIFAKGEFVLEYNSTQDKDYFKIICFK